MATIEQILAKFQDLCRELNMDKETEENAWTSYKDVSQKFTLDGDPYHWLCCALYAACRESYTPTVGGSNEVVKGNCVSPIKLLRSCKISLYEFFTKMKNWCEMANVPEYLIQQVKFIENDFIITLHLFKRYKQIFDAIFIVSPHEKKNKKARPIKCSATKLYKFCWCLYLCAKNEKNCNVDLVTSFHLLLCCVDLVYVNALAENRVDLINPNFEGVPKKWNTSEFNISTAHEHCILGALCKMTDGLRDEALKMKQKTWRNIVAKFLATKTLLGKNDTFMGIISNNNFEPNLKSLTSAYEHYILSVGDFDERIFLQAGSNESSGGNNVCINQNSEPLVPKTPLTRRDDLPRKGNIIEPVASATQSVGKLLEIAHLNQPSEFIKQAGEASVQRLLAKIHSMGAIFIDKFPMESEAKNRFELALSLFFDLLEKILRAETPPNVDIKILLENSSFISTLVACCLEIVLDAYKWQSEGILWVLKCFLIKPYSFIKIIEIVVRQQKGRLDRESIKHLNWVEEHILSLSAWTNDSIVWEILDDYQKVGGKFPSWKDVDVNEKVHNHNVNMLQSPINSAHDCFNPTASTSTESARKDLFNAGKATESKSSDLSKPSPVDFKKFSLHIFLRKFYKLAWMRLKELCKELGLEDENHISTIWTVFEYSITHRTKLMQDRHLDQLLMCAIYIYIKVKEIPGKTFTDIMKLYKKQPQSESNIYREVLINPAETEKSKRYNDIIYFYNNIYVQQLSPRALNFSDKKKSQHDLLRSPHPTDKINPPKKLSNHIFIHQLEKNTVTHSPNDTEYVFANSPAKHLYEMNKKVRQSKRNLQFNEEEIEAKKSKSNPHLQGQIWNITKDRQEQKP